MKQFFLTFCAACLLMACEAPYVGEPSSEPESSQDVNVTLRVTGFEQIPFENEGATRADEDVVDLCSRLNFVIYSGADKVKSVAQKRGDKDYGTAAFSLPEGTYTFAVIGHQSEGTCTVTSLDKITFKDNRVTDTFLYCGDIEVTSEAKTYDVELHRVVAMVRFTIADEIPAEVKQMQFYYTGGSSTLSALTGYGSVNSRQTVKIDVKSGQQLFELYTFPHAETGELKMTVTPLDATGEAWGAPVTFENLPVSRNYITCYTGEFFTDNSGQKGGVSFNFSASSAWDGEINYTP